MTEYNSEKELNTRALKKLESRVFSYEYENHSTKKLSDADMVKKIMRAIEEIVSSEDKI